MKHSIQKHNISNLSPLAPALRGLEDARTQRWTFCKPCSMEQNVQVQGEDCQYGMTIKHVWENANCQNTELPRPRCWQWAWIENFMQRQHFYARSLNTAKMNHDKFIVKKRKHTNTTETVNTARVHDQWNGRLSTCLLKASSAHEKSAARWKNAKNIHLTSIFNISDQRPKKLPKWVSGISKRAFSGQAEGQEMLMNKYWELQNQHFWARAQQMPNMSLGIGHWKCPNGQINFGSL